MQRRRTFTVMAILLAVLILGVGYATVTNVTLNLNGNANVNANFDFTVVYDTNHTPVVSPTGNTTTTTTPAQTHPYVTAAYTDASNATMTVWFDKNQTEAYAIYKVDNKSSQLGAELSTVVTPVQVGGVDSSYFDTVVAGYYTDATCTNALGNNTVEHGNSVYLKVEVRLVKAPVQDITSGTFTVTTTATPVDGNL